MPTFSDILEAADRLPLDDQQTLLEILRRRIAQRNRDRIVDDVATARAEFATGQSKAASVAEIMAEAGDES